MQAKMINSSNDCIADHSKIVSFDSIAAKGLDPVEVQKRWPRVVCQECNTLLYASADHLMAGNW